MKKHYLTFKVSLLLAGLLLSQNLSSQCEIGFATDATDTVLEVNSSGKYGQGFIAECSGQLEYVQLISTGSGIFTSGTLNIFNGNGVTGTLIYTQDYASLTIVDGRRPIKIDIINTLDIEKDNQYTFQFETGEVGVLAASGNQYSGGYAVQEENTLENFDFFFTVSISEKSLSINDTETSLKLVLLPNPSKDFVQVSNLNGQKRYEIFNVFGKQISKGFTGNKEKIDISNLQSGMYFLKIEDNTTFKFLKQ